MVVQGTVNQEVLITKKKEVPLLRHLSTVLGQYQRSLGKVPRKSWDSAKEVLGQRQRSLGTVQSGDSLGTVQSWDSLGPEQSWYSLGTVQP